MLMYIFLIIGFILLIKGADFFVDGCCSVAKTFRVPSIIIGLTIVAFGTSAPEAAVSITAGLQGNNAIAVSNIIGSNIFNLLVVLGACSLFSKIKVSQALLIREYPFSIIISLLLLVLGYDTLFNSNASNVISRINGLILLGFFIFFLVTLIVSSIKNRTEADDEYKILPIWKSGLFIILGGAAIIWGGNLVVDSATDIAKSFGLSDTLIGLTIVALGTSLPELVTSIVAAKKGECDLALGNVVGSNIFNILLILGVSSALNPIPLDIASIIDLILLIIFSIIVYLFCITKKCIDKKEGIAMLLMYLAYMVYIIIRN